MKSFKERLKELREKKRLLQNQIADDLKVPRSTYSNWEQGRSEPDIAMIKKICIFFKCGYEDLLGAIE